jgi:hypothetical protein
LAQKQRVRFTASVAPKRAGSFQPDYVTPDRRRAQYGMFGLAPIPVIRLAVMTSCKRTLLAPIGYSHKGDLWRSDEHRSAPAYDPIPTVGLSSKTSINRIFSLFALALSAYCTSISRLL